MNLRTSECVTLFGNGVFADVISEGPLDEIILDLGWDQNPMTDVPIRCLLLRGYREAHEEKEAMGRWRQRLELSCHKLRNSKKSPKMEEARKDLQLTPLEAG